MSELTQYYMNFSQAYWAHPEASKCGCQGRGWALSQVDTWHRCPYHGNGVPHPEDDNVGEKPEAQPGDLFVLSRPVKRGAKAMNHVSFLMREDGHVTVNHYSDHDMTAAKSDCLDRYSARDVYRRHLNASYCRNRTEEQVQLKAREEQAARLAAVARVHADRPAPEGFRHVRYD